MLTPNKEHKTKLHCHDISTNQAIWPHYVSGDISMSPHCAVVQSFLSFMESHFDLGLNLA